MNLEPIIQSEVSQKEKNKFCILMHIWNLEGWYWWTCSQSSNGDADIENILMDKGGGEEGEGVLNGGVAWVHITYVNREPVGICCMTQGTQTGAL